MGLCGRPGSYVWGVVFCPVCGRGAEGGARGRGVRTRNTASTV